MAKEIIDNIPFLSIFILFLLLLVPIFTQKLTNINHILYVIGLFAGVSLDGSVISISVKRNREYWGQGVSAADALKKPATDKRIQPLIKALDELIKKAK